MVIPILSNAELSCATLFNHQLWGSTSLYFAKERWRLQKLEYSRASWEKQAICSNFGIVWHPYFFWKRSPLEKSEIRDSLQRDSSHRCCSDDSSLSFPSSSPNRSFRQTFNGFYEKTISYWAAITTWSPTFSIFAFLSAFLSAFFFAFLFSPI